MANQLELSQKPFIELQIKALIDDNSVNSKRVLKFIDKFESKLLSVDKVTIDKILNKQCRIPIVERPGFQAEYTEPKDFKFALPEKIDVIGGFRVSTVMTKSNYVDLAVCIPAEIFEKKDFKNQKYHLKRALYLALIGQLLQEHIGEELVQNIEFKYHQGDFLKPVLLFQASDPKLINVTKFQLFAYPHSEAPLKPSLLHPAHGNVAPRWFFEKYKISEPVGEDITEFLLGDSADVKSPFYNSGIMFDMEIVANSDLLFQQIGTQISITDSLMLVKIWLYQRNLHHHFSFVASMFVLYLQTKQVISGNMSSFQIFKVVIKSLATSDWSTNGLSYYEDFEGKIKEFQEFFPVVFVSPSGRMNICYNISEDLYNRVKHEADLANKMLSSNMPETFESLFLKKVKFANKFDAFLHLPKSTTNLPVQIDYLRKFLDQGVLTPRVLSHNIINLIKRCLTDRIVLVQQNSNHILLEQSWHFRKVPMTIGKNSIHSTLSIGLLLNAEKSLKIIDIGPNSQDGAPAEEFRNFWGKKSQLRLQNGSINETVAWHVESFGKRRHIVRYALEHVIKRSELHQYIVHHTLFEDFISLNNVWFQWKDQPQLEQTKQIEKEQNDKSAKKRPHENKLPKGQPFGSGEEIYLKAQHEYNVLSKVLRQLDKLKYSITGIQPVSKFMRNCAIFPPLPINLQPICKSIKRRRGYTVFADNMDQLGRVLHIEPIEILVTLEGTGKWPNDLEALDAAILDFLIGVCESLKETGRCVRLLPEKLQFDVVQGQFVFRIKIKCPKEMVLLTQFRMSHKDQYAERKFDLEMLPRLSAALDKLHHEQPIYSLTCRLVKRWITCQLLAGHISELTIELIIGYLFLHPYPYTEPSSSLCGLVRFFNLIADFDWSSAPIVVNFDSMLKLDEVNKFKDSMQADRSKYPAMVICTPFESFATRSPYTRAGPSAPILDLLVRLCKRAREFVARDILVEVSPQPQQPEQSSLEGAINGCSECLPPNIKEELRALFRPSFKLFNLLIKLKASVVQNFYMSVDAPGEFKLVARESANDVKVMPVVGLNAVEALVSKLRAELGELALFFHDPFGQRVIGVMMKPHSGRKLKDNFGAFKAKIRTLGDKMVDSIVVKHNNESL